MLAIFSLLVVLTLSLLLIRVATLALTYTGLSRQTARFQARSVFTGVGFATQESEMVVNHPVRRRILLLLMLVGNAGIVTAITTLIIGFLDAPDEASIIQRILILAVGLAVLITMATSQWVDRRLSRVISWALERYTQLEITDYSSLLHLAGEYFIRELYVQEDDWLADARIGDLHLTEEGVLILGINRKDGTYIGTPGADSRILPADIVVVYGRAAALTELDQRRKGFSGQVEHAEAVSVRKKVQDQERLQDKEGLRREEDGGGEGDDGCRDCSEPLMKKAGKGE